jgi:inorganic pyrophosphatase
VAVAKKASTLADPTQLKPVHKGDGSFQVIVETPRGSRNKFAFDAKQKIFILKAVLPAGMTFPYDFGFLPQTKAGDGDPLDVLLLMDEPATPGIAVRSRLIGVIEGEQLDHGQKVRNDRLLAVAETSHLYANIRGLDDLPGQLIRELEDFFVNYHRLEGKQYKLVSCKGVHAAMHLVEKLRT